MSQQLTSMFIADDLIMSLSRVEVFDGHRSFSCIFKKARTRTSSSESGSEEEVNETPANDVCHRNRLRESTGTDQGPSVDKLI